MSLPPGKKWVIQNGESVEVTALGHIYRQLWLRHTKTDTDPYWVFQDAGGQTIYLGAIEAMRRTNLINLAEPSENVNA